MQVVEEAETEAEVCAVITRVCPDVVVIDLDRHDAESWLGVIEAVRSQCPAAAVVAVGASSRLAGPVLEAGADAFLSKLESPATLCDAVDAAVRQTEANRRDRRGPRPG